MAMNRKRKFIATIALAAGLITYVVVSRTPRHAGSTPADSQSSVITETKASLAAPIHIATRDSSIQPTALIRAATSDSAVTPPNARTPQQLVAEILEISSAEGPITAEKAAQFKRNLEELIKRGAVSVPAIRELLDKKIEYDFMDVAGGEQIGYASLRASLIDALKQIGGPDAQEAMVQEAPGIYREQILNAARESLAIAATNQLVANLELGPAFRIIQNYGGDYTTADGANNEPANFNNAVNLANMPDGQGLAALVQMAQTPSSASAQTIATEMIAQMAGENAKAADSLMQLAQNGQISNSTWEKLAPILGGDQFQIANSPAQNQGFTVVNNTTTADQINQRIVLIDQFLGVVPSDSAAAASLRNQRKLLTGKLPR